MDPWILVQNWHPRPAVPASPRAEGLAIGERVFIRGPGCIVMQMPCLIAPELSGDRQYCLFGKS